MTGEAHLTPQEVGKRLKIHPATVLRLFHEGILPGIPLSQGKQRTVVRFRLSTIESWEKKRERTMEVGNGHRK
jgi:predicted site-specific integrase-resolvase